MAIENPQFTTGALSAGATLAQFIGVAASATADYTAVLPGAGASIIGVTGNSTTSGQAVDLIVAGIAKGLVGTVAVTRGDELEVEATGAFIPMAPPSTARIVGVALQSGAVGSLISVLLKDGTA